MTLELLGDPLFAKDKNGKLLSRIGTVFLKSGGLVTTRNVHALQRLEWVRHLNSKRAADGYPELDDFDVEAEMAEAVDLIFDDGIVLIRPIPTAAGMRLAFLADRIFQQTMSKRNIRFLNIQHKVVKQALRERGEIWRMSAPSLSDEAVRKTIQDSRVGIGCGPVYYYNQQTGSRYLTLQTLRAFAELSDDDLRRQLAEIAEYSGKRNRFGQFEIDFFPAGIVFPRELFTAQNFEAMSSRRLRAYHQVLTEAFAQLVPPEISLDDIDRVDWCQAMCSALSAGINDTVDTEAVKGLSPEFFMRIEWLPGGRIEQDGEFVPDEIFEEARMFRLDAQLQDMCDQTALGLLFNHVREFFDIEHINIGRIRASLNNRAEGPARAKVYIVEVKEKATQQPTIRVIRVQKWTVAHYLDEGRELLDAVMMAAEYTDYVMDRRMGCRQLGMRLPAKLVQGRVREWYHGTNRKYANAYIWAGYFERDYIGGRATNKVPSAYYQNPEFNRRLAYFLGSAAAVNLIVGRSYAGGQVFFDDGDEVLLLNEHNLPADMVVSDVTGSFNNYKGRLVDMLPAYGRTIDVRKTLIPNPEEFVQRYVDAFRGKFKEIREDYLFRKRAFSSLFRDRPFDEAGSFSYRWLCVLDRLEVADPDGLSDQLLRLCGDVLKK